MNLAAARPCAFFGPGGAAPRTPDFCRRVPGLVPADEEISASGPSSFWRGPKGTKSPLRGTNPSDKGRPPGFFPLRTPSSSQSPLSFVSAQGRRKLRFASLLVLSPPKPLTLGFGGGPKAGEQNWCVTLTTGVLLLTLPATHGGPRPFAQVTCHPVPRLWAPALGVQACEPAPLTAQAPKGPASGGVSPGPQAPKHTDAAGRRPSGEAAQPRLKDAGKRSRQSN